MDESFIKKIPPHDETAERSVVGSMIIDPDAITVASEILEADDFYQAVLVSRFHRRHCQAFRPVGEQDQVHALSLSGQAP